MQGHIARTFADSPNNNSSFHPSLLKHSNGNFMTSPSDVTVLWLTIQRKSHLYSSV